MERFGRLGSNQSGQRLPSLFRCKHGNATEDGRDRGARVLVVDDEHGIRKLLHASLSSYGYEVFLAASGEEALREVPISRPDVIILDLGLPDLDGVDVTHTLREWTEVPIVVLSVRDQEFDKIAALDAGADDYLTKPFSTGELEARLRVALRRSSRLESDGFSAGELTVDLIRRRVQVGERKVQLTPTEYELLKVLVRNPDRVLTHRQLIQEIWGGACYEDEMHLLRVNVSNLRHKLEADPTRPRYIVTEPGVGYRLRAA
jgi:two-component system KDP operon response regulator KdpE